MTQTARTLVRLAALLSLTAAAAPSASAQTPRPAPPEPAVKVGAPAPDFTLSYLVVKPDGGFDNREVTLSSFKGRQNVVLAFFPAAFSPG
jgi:hypothetical protein